MSYSSAEAKKEFFLTTDDLRDLPMESVYMGFGTGPPTKVYFEEDLEAAAIAKHGKEGLAKKRASREKRESNKRKREEEAAAAIDPAVVAEKERIIERNMKIVGKKWDLEITSPERVAGTKAELKFGCLPPTGWPGKFVSSNYFHYACDVLVLNVLPFLSLSITSTGESNIDCRDFESLAYSFGNIHGFKGKSSESDKEMKFVTKWKTCGHRYSGTLSLQVKPSDMDDRKPSSKIEVNQKDESSKENVENSSQNTAPSHEVKLMVVGKFDSGINSGVRSWSFKGYRQEGA